MALAQATRDELKTLYNALADRVLEPGDPVYVAQVNHQGMADAVEEMATEIDWQEGGGVCLFTGQRGTGKSTELKRLKKRLEQLGAVVFYVDLSEFMLLTKEVEISDFLDKRAFLQQLHKRMFGAVWQWAGQFRTTARNIGIGAYRIPVELRALCDDIRYQITNGTYAPDEIAIRFHHRLVFIHAFPNGNGRHARLAADLLARQLQVPRFTWGSVNLVDAAEVRRRYVEALRAADAHDISALLGFARS